MYTGAECGEFRFPFACRSHDRLLSNDFGSRCGTGERGTWGGRGGGGSQIPPEEACGGPEHGRCGIYGGGGLLSVVLAVSIECKAMEVVFL